MSFYYFQILFAKHKGFTVVDPRMTTERNVVFLFIYNCVSYDVQNLSVYAYILSLFLYYYDYSSHMRVVFCYVTDDRA